MSSADEMSAGAKVLAKKNVEAFSGFRTEMWPYASSTE